MVSFLLLTDHRPPPPAKVKEEWTKEQVKVPLTMAGLGASLGEAPESSLGNQEKFPLSLSWLCFGMQRFRSQTHSYSHLTRFTCSESTYLWFRVLSDRPDIVIKHKIWPCSLQGSVQREEN